MSGRIGVAHVEAWRAPSGLRAPIALAWCGASSCPMRRRSRRARPLSPRRRPRSPGATPRPTARRRMRGAGLCVRGVRRDVGGALQTEDDAEGGARGVIVGTRVDGKHHPPVFVEGGIWCARLPQCRCSTRSRRGRKLGRGRGEADAGVGLRRHGQRVVGVTIARVDAERPVEAAPALVQSKVAAIAEVIFTSAAPIASRPRAGTC